MSNYPIRLGVYFKDLMPIHQQINMIETTSNHLIWVIVQSIIAILHHRGVLTKTIMDIIYDDFRSIGPVRLNYHQIKNDSDNSIIRMILMVMKCVETNFNDSVSLLSGSRSIGDPHDTLIRWINIIFTQSNRMRCDYDNVIVLTNLFNVLNVSELIII